ncbi:MAG: tetratricopeptide repeat protein [bacterium]|nr:tetratricopeptide repeat protein [bacterium]
MKTFFLATGIFVVSILLTLFIFYTDTPKVKALFEIRKKQDSLSHILEDPFKKGRLILESEEALGRGLAFLINGDLGKALFEFNDAIRLDSNNYRAYYNKGIVYRLGENFTDAEKEYRKCIEIAPKFYAAYNNLANLFLITAQYDSAFKYIDLAVTAHPDCTDYVDTKIDVLLARNQLDSAYKLWKEAFQKNEQHIGLFNKKSKMDAIRRP